MTSTDHLPQWSQYSPDGQWWWDGRQWLPVAGSAPRDTPLVRYSSDGRWWWDGREWHPVARPARSRTRGSVIVHVALGAAFLVGYAAMMMAIGVADLRASAAFSPGAAEVLLALAVGAPPVVLGTIAFFRLPARDALRLEALVAILLGLGAAAFLLFLIFA